MICPDCNGTGFVMSKHGGIGLKDGKWHTYSAPVKCWRCARKAALQEMQDIGEDLEPLADPNSVQSVRTNTKDDGCSTSR